MNSTAQAKRIGHCAWDKSLWFVW